MSDFQDIDILCFAIANGNVTLILEILNSAIDLNQQDQYGNTPLATACGGRMDDDAEIVELLIMRGADVNLKDKSGLTPIHAAAYTVNEEKLKVLIRSKANLDVKTEMEDKDKDAFTPLMRLADTDSGHEEEMEARIKCIELLLEHRASASLTNAKGETALDLAKQVDVTHYDGRTSLATEMLEAAMKKEENKVDEPPRRFAP